MLGLILYYTNSVHYFSVELVVFLKTIFFIFSWNPSLRKY